TDGDDARAQVLRDLDRPVGRPVVHDDDLRGQTERGDAFLDRPKRRRQMELLVVRRDDDREAHYGNAASSSRTNSSASSSVNGIGGRIFNTLSNGPSVPSRMPRSRMRFTTSDASPVAGSSVSRSFTSSTPMKRPEPRTSPTIGCVSR